MSVERVIKSRRSVRKYKSKKPDWRDILESIDAMKFSPMSGNSFNLKVIVVDDKEKIANIAVSSQQQFIQDSPYLLVVCSNEEIVKNMYSNKGQEYSSQQSGAAIQNLLLSLTEKGIASCWIGYFVENQIKKILAIPDKYKVQAIITAGYANEKPKERKKIELENIIFFNKYGNKRMNA